MDQMEHRLSRTATLHQVPLASLSSFQLLLVRQQLSNFRKRICCYEEWSEKDSLATMTQSTNTNIIITNTMGFEK